MIRICDLKEDEVVVGLRVRSLINPDKTGVIVSIDHDDDRFAWLHWDDKDYPSVGFYGNDCKCEVIGNVFTPEEQIIIAGREEEKKARSKIIDKLAVAQKAGDTEAFQKAVDELRDSTPDRCEHDRSIWGTCIGCSELEDKIKPFIYDED